MSTTSTSTATRQDIQSALDDYTIHLTGSDPSSYAPSSHQPPNRATSPAAQNPTDWPENYHRVPDFRPIERGRIPEERPNGNNGFERGFLTIMFSGVVLNATTAKVWGATGGKYFKELFRYQIGGEW